MQRPRRWYPPGAACAFSAPSIRLMRVRIPSNRAFQGGKLDPASGRGHRSALPCHRSSRFECYINGGERFFDGCDLALVSSPDRAAYITTRLVRRNEARRDRLSRTPGIAVWQAASRRLVAHGPDPPAPDAIGHRERDGAARQRPCAPQCWHRNSRYRELGFMT